MEFGKHLCWLLHRKKLSDTTVSEVVMWKTYFLIVLPFCVSGLDAQHVATLPTEPGLVKIDDGRICWWRTPSVDPSTPDVRIFTSAGDPVTAIAVLSLVPDAKSVSVYDVAVRRDRIAVAAVYSKQDGSQPAAAMIFFDEKGKPLSFFTLHPSRGVLKLALDEKLNVWTLTNESGGISPSEAPMIVEYDASGRVVRELLTRELFPVHAEAVEESPTTGSASLGYQTGTLWFWLPGSTDLVTIQVDTGRITRASTGLPGPDSAMMPLGVYRLSSGSVLAQIREKDGNGSAVAKLYAWTPQSKRWTPSVQPSMCAARRLIGTGDHELLFLNHVGQYPDICSEPLPQP